MEPFQEGKTFYACGTAVIVREDTRGETHIFRASDGICLSKEDLTGGVVFGGGKGESLTCTNVTMESGFLKDLFGGGEDGFVKSIKISLLGGLIERYFCGGGLDDSVGSVEFSAMGGVVRHSVFAFGMSKRCECANVLYDGTLCTNFRLGSKHLDAEILGESHFIMKSGHIFDLAFGAKKQKGRIAAEICGGTVEQRISARCEPEKLSLKLYENIFYPDGHGGFFPRLPERLPISYLPKIKKEMQKSRTGKDAFFFDTAGEKGKLVFRFFGLRHPEVSHDITPFSDFIGDAFLISFPNGQHMLVDTGMPYAYGEIYNSLKKLNVKKIDFLMITHSHIDHIGNAEKILLDFSVSELWLPDLDMVLSDEEEKMEKDLLLTAKQKGVLFRKVGRGDRIFVGEGELSSEILILNPNRGDKELADPNGVSIACKVSFQKGSAILGGDISEREEKQILCDFPGELACDLIKLSHHGIVYQNSPAFIEACSPKKAVVQNTRDEGAFVKITSFALEKANGFSKDNLFVTGKHGKIKVILSDQGKLEIATEF